MGAEEEPLAIRRDQGGTERLPVEVVEHLRIAADHSGSRTVKIDNDHFVLRPTLIEPDVDHVVAVR